MNSRTKAPPPLFVYRFPQYRRTGGSVLEHGRHSTQWYRLNNTSVVWVKNVLEYSHFYLVRYFFPAGGVVACEGLYKTWECVATFLCHAISRCWHHIKTPSPVVNLLWTGHPSVAACNRRWSFICCCWPQALEHSAWGHYICVVSTGVWTTTEDSFVSAILSRHYIVTCVDCCAQWSVVLEVVT